MKNVLITIAIILNGNVKPGGIDKLDENSLKKMIKSDIIDLDFTGFEALNLTDEQIKTLESFCKIPRKPLTKEERDALSKAKKEAEKKRKEAEKKLTKNAALYIVLDKLAENPDTLDNICKNVFDVYNSDKTEVKAANDWFKFAVVSNCETLLHYGILSIDDKKLYSLVKK